jgi:hypothetical protein
MAIIDSRNKDARGRTIVPERESSLRHSNPLTWARYSKDVNYSVSGLGSTRTFKSHPGKHIPMRVATWRESPAEADRAARAAVRAHRKSQSGAFKSL